MDKSKVFLIFALSAVMLSGCGNEAGKEIEVTEGTTTAPQIIVEVLTEPTTVTEETEPAPETEVQDEKKESILQLAKECHEAEINENIEVLREKSNVKEFVQVVTGNSADEEDLTEYLYSEDGDSSFHSEYTTAIPTGYGDPIQCSDDEIKAMNDYIQLLYNSAEHKQGETNTYIVTDAYKVEIEYAGNSENENTTANDYEAYIYVLEANDEWKYDMWVSITAFVINSYNIGNAN